LVGLSPDHISGRLWHYPGQMRNTGFNIGGLPCPRGATSTPRSKRVAGTTVQNRSADAKTRVTSSRTAPIQNDRGVLG
jgi:hypothetical protein